MLAVKTAAQMPIPTALKILNLAKLALHDRKQKNREERSAVFALLYRFSMPM